MYFVSLMIKGISLLLLMTACSFQSDGEKFLDILENRYANLEINKEEKLIVLEKIKNFVNEGKFNVENIEQIKKLLLEMKDYHLMIGPVSESTSIKEKECISSNIVSSDTFSIKVHSLWCEIEKVSSIDRFQNEFKEHALKAKKYENLIIDLRGNRGGGDKETRYLLERLIHSRSFLYQYQYTNASLPIYRRGLGKFASKETDYILPVKDAVDYLGDKKVTAYIDEETFSSAEVVASVLKFSKSARLLGETTRGGAGDPVGELFFDGKYELIYPTCIVWQEDGSLYEQHGVTPHSKLD